MRKTWFPAIPAAFAAIMMRLKKSIKLVLNQHLHMNTWENLSGDNLRHSNAALLRTSAIDREPADIDDTGDAW